MTEMSTADRPDTCLGTVTTTATENRLLDYEAAAALLGVRPRTIRSLAESHKIDTVKVASRTRIETAALARYVDAHRVPATGAVAK